MNEYELYKLGNSIPEISNITKIPKSTLRFRFKKEGILRSRKDGINLAAKKGKLSGNKGVTRKFSKEWKDNIRTGRLKWSNNNSKGVSFKKCSGYLEFTKGKNKFKCVHIVILEKYLGRKLQSNEVVHHCDYNKLNNKITNLELMTRSEHSRLHAKHNLKNRKRNNRGQFI